MENQLDDARRRDDARSNGSIGRNVYVARQPILDIKQRVYAYELLFRAGLHDLCCTGVDPNEASRQVVHNAFMTLGVDRLLGGRRAFVNVTADALVSGWIDALPSETTVIELLETIDVTDEVVDACRRLKQQGFQIALDDFVCETQWEPLLDVADFIKVSFRDTPPDERHRLADLLRPRGLRLLAEQVETRDEFDEAVELGYSYYQGYFLFRPETVAGREINGSRVSSLRLLRAINTRNAPRREVEDIIGRDAALSHKLLRYLNSACFSFRGPISSIRNALLLLGDDNLRRWAALLSIGDIGQDKPQELLVTSAIRARFCETLAPLVGFPQREAELFLLGLFSLLDALLDQPMPEALESMRLSPELSHAIEGDGSELRAVLDLVVAYERADWSGVSAAARRIDVAVPQLPPLYLDATEWAGQLFGE